MDFNFAVGIAAACLAIWPAIKVGQWFWGRAGFDTIPPADPMVGSMVVLPPLLVLAAGFGAGFGLSWLLLGS